MDLGELIASRLMTQLDLAYASDVEQANISRYVRGHLKPRVATIRKLARGLGVSNQEVYNAVQETQRRKELANVN